jgi:hypothetical protein
MIYPLDLDLILLSALYLHLAGASRYCTGLGRLAAIPDCGAALQSEVA